MYTYESLLKKVSKEATVYECNLFIETQCYGLYRNGSIFIDRFLPLKEKLAYLAEEFGHHKTTAGNIIKLNNRQSIKYENIARRYSYELLVSFEDWIDCFDEGCTNVYECAENLNIPEKILLEVINYYYQKYGHKYIYKNYLLYFSDLSVWIVRCTESA